MVASSKGGQAASIVAVTRLYCNVLQAMRRNVTLETVTIGL